MDAGTEGPSIGQQEIHLCLETARRVVYSQVAGGARPLSHADHPLRQMFVFVRACRVGDLIPPVCPPACRG